MNDEQGEGCYGEIKIRESGFKWFSGPKLSLTPYFL